MSQFEHGFDDHVRIELKNAENAFSKLGDRFEQTACPSSIPSNPASQSVLFMANAKDQNFSRVSERLADAIFKQSIEIENLAVEKGRFCPPVSGR